MANQQSPFGKINWYKFILEDVWSPDRLEQFKKVLSPLGDAITAASKRIDQVPEDEDLVDEEAHFVEDLIGAAFVIAQSQIESSFTAVKRLDEHLVKETGQGLTFTTKRKEIIKNAPDQAGSSGRTAVEVIEAAGNLFKHRDQWIGEWSKNPVENDNIKILVAVGCSHGSSGNFRQCAKSVGITSYEKIADLEDFLWNWSLEIHKSLSAELRQRNLI